MKKVKIVTIVVISVLSLIVFLQNTQVVETKILFMTVTMSRALLLILTFGMGFTTGLVGSFLLKKSGKSKQQNQEKNSNA